MKICGVFPTIEILLSTKGIVKIISAMQCRSLQSECLSACILKYIKYYFHEFFGE